MDAYMYEPLDAGRYRATSYTQGPWNPAHQHGSPPAALLARELERADPNPGFAFARVTMDLLGGVPVGEVQLSSRVVRSGARIQLIDAEMSDGHRTVARAQGWRIRRADTTAEATPPRPAPIPLPADGTTTTPDLGFGYQRAVEWRFAKGAPVDPGPATIWARLHADVVAGEKPSPLQQVAALVDIASGMANELDFLAFSFASIDLDIRLLRDLSGPWLCIDAHDTTGPHGSGLARTTLYDQDGDLGSVTQTLFVDRL